MKKRLLILIAIAVVITTSLIIAVSLYRPNTVKIVAYDNYGVKFSYFNSWNLNSNKADETTTINLQKKLSSSNISIEVRELPPSYKNYTFLQIIEAVKSKISNDNPDWKYIYTDAFLTGKNTYTSQQTLYENKSQSKQSSVVIGQSGQKLFIITMESNRNDFDIISHDLDLVTDSFEIK
ncbi:MAG: hypothetical protein WCK26_01690 [Candidatus Saccharibacteria bacterium]